MSVTAYPKMICKRPHPKIPQANRVCTFVVLKKNNLGVVSTQKTVSQIATPHCAS